jgi:hypothetical protein
MKNLQPKRTEPKSNPESGTLYKKLVERQYIERFPKEKIPNREKDPRAGDHREPPTPVDKKD